MMIYNTHLLRELRRTIGQNIHCLRVKHKIMLQKLSRDTGISEGLLDKFELGKHEISLEILLKIACALNISVSKIIG